MTLAIKVFAAGLVLVFVAVVVLVMWRADPPKGPAKPQW